MWTESNHRLRAVFKFANFTEAFAFMTEVAFAAERMDHHPNWQNIWNTVTIDLCTHDAGNTVTEKDQLLAAAIDDIAKKYNYSRK